MPDCQLACSPLLLSLGLFTPLYDTTRIYIAPLYASLRHKKFLYNPSVRGIYHARMPADLLPVDTQFWNLLRLFKTQNVSLLPLWPRYHPCQIASLLAPLCYSVLELFMPIQDTSRFFVASISTVRTMPGISLLHLGMGFLFTLLMHKTARIASHFLSTVCIHCIRHARLSSP